MDSVKRTEPKQIERVAAGWLARRDGGEWTAMDEAALQSWLEEGTAHRIAYLRVETVWEESKRLKAFAGGLAPEAGEKSNWTLPLFDPRPGPDAMSAHKPVRRRMRSIALVAGVLLTMGAAAYWVADRLLVDRYATPVGGVASVPLQDGSSVTLNTASEIRVKLTEVERRVELAQGEAFFDVAKDPARPFRVVAGDKRIVAIGTRFSVRRSGEDVRVVVTEGSVRIDDPSGAGQVLAAGSVVRTQHGAVQVRKTTLPETENILSWRMGYLTFNDTPLAEAIGEFNQYNKPQIVTSDSVVAGIPLTGKFKATHYDAFVRLLEEGYAIQARRAGDTITLTRP